MLENVANRYPETAYFIADNLKEVCKNEKISINEIIYCIDLLFWGSKLVDCLLVCVLAVLFLRVDKLNI